MNDIFFHGVWRMDWGFGNPNRTAAFIAILLVAFWILPWLSRRLYWLSLAASIILGIALLHTLSRGGVIALALGILPLLYWARRPWPKAKWLAGILAFWIVVFGAVALKAHERFAQGVFSPDRSITNRLQIWRQTPAMMVDAPAGWGLGNAANAFHQWYQPLDQNEAYLNLVSSHLTWLVEFNWLERAAYILAWMLVLGLCWPGERTRWYSVALAAWLTFFVSAIFTHVASTPVMWIFPVLFLIAVTAHRLFHKIPLTRRQCIFAPAATGLIILAIYVSGLLSSQVSLRGSCVQIGGSDPSGYVVYNSETMGSRYGKNIRATLAAAAGPQPAFHLLMSAEKIPPMSGKTLVLGGILPPHGRDAVLEAVQECARLVLLNPHFFPVELKVSTGQAGKVTAYFGDFSQSPSIEDWQALISTEPLPGSGDFVPDWPALVLGLMKSNPCP